MKTIFPTTLSSRQYMFYVTRFLRPVLLAYEKEKKYNDFGTPLHIFTAGASRTSELMAGVFQLGSECAVRIIENFFHRCIRCGVGIVFLDFLNFYFVD